MTRRSRSLGEMFTLFGTTGPVRIQRPSRAAGHVGVCLGLAVVLLTTACSDSDTGSSKATTTTEGTATTRPAAAAKRPNIVFVLTDDLDLASYTDNPKMLPECPRPADRARARRSRTTSSPIRCVARRARRSCAASTCTTTASARTSRRAAASNAGSSSATTSRPSRRGCTTRATTPRCSASTSTAIPHTVAHQLRAAGLGRMGEPERAATPTRSTTTQLNENGKLQALRPEAERLSRRRARAEVTRLHRGEHADTAVLPLRRAVRPAPTRDARAALRQRVPGLHAAEVTVVRPGRRVRRAAVAAATAAAHGRGGHATSTGSHCRRARRACSRVEDMLETIVDALRATHQLDNTYIVFTSDNGFHLGQHRLPPGKQTPFEEDIHVPLVVRGPGVPVGRTSRLRPRDRSRADVRRAGTANTPSFVDGVSLTPLLTSDDTGDTTRRPADVLIEHYADVGTRAGRRTSARSRASTASFEPDDDAHPPVAGAPTSGAAAPVRTPRMLAVGIPPYLGCAPRDTSTSSTRPAGGSSTT